MVSVPSPFGGDDDVFEPRDEFVPESIPAPGDFLAGHDLLTGGRHLAFHRLSRALFEERAVYDMTFGYNLARLNEDTRHPTAGYRYAVEDPHVVASSDGVDTGTGTDAGGDDDLPRSDEGLSRPDDGPVLRAEFTPTTAFCPQSDTLTKGSFRAWNGLADRHEFALVRVRVAPMHQRAAVINEQLRELERAVVETGSVPDGSGGGLTGDDAADGGPATARDGTRSPF